MKRIVRWSVALPALALVLAACGQAAAPPTPTLAPTATLAPTPPPTATAAAANEGTVEGGTLMSALQNAKTASSYRVDMEMRGKGDLGLPGQSGNEDVSLFTMTGEFKGADAHYTFKGVLSTLLGVDANRGLEAITAGGKNYLRGPVSMLGANEDKWYVLEADESEAIKPPIQATDFLSSVAGSGADLSAFKQTGTETIDGKSCTIYTGDKDAALKAFSSVNAGSIAGADVDQVKDAQMSFAMCDDGYPHRMQMTAEANASNKPDQTFTFNINMHIYDFNAPINVSAPADAVPLPVQK
jgi:hypothetical protein